MKVLFNTLVKINYNQIVSNDRYCYSKTFVTDTFEKNNISFTGNDQKTKGKINRIVYVFGLDKNTAQICVENNLNDLQIKRLKSMSAELGIEEKITYIDFDDVLIEKLESLNKFNKNLTPQDKIAIVAYELVGENDAENIIKIESYLEKKKIGLRDYEAALASKLGLSEKQVKTYLSKKDNTIEYDNKTKSYTPTEDEWMNIIKEDFNNEQLEQFASIRNEKIDLKEKTVRKQGGEQYLPIEFIIDCIKKGYSNKEIKASKRLIEFAEYDFPIDIQAQILVLSEKEYSRFKECFEDIEDVKRVLNFVSCTDEQYNKYKNLVSNGLNNFLAMQLALYTKECYERFEELVDNEEENIFNAIELAQLTKVEYERFRELKSNGFGRETILDLLQLTERQYKRYKKLLNEGVNKNLARDVAELTEKQYKKYIALVNNNEDEYEALIDALLTEDQVEQYEKIIIEDNIISPFEVLDLVKLTEEQYKKYKQLVNVGESKYFALQLAQLAEEQYKKYQKFTNSGESADEALQLAQLTEDQYEKYQELISNGQINGIALQLAQLTDEQYKRFTDRVRNGENIVLAMNRARLTENHYKRFVDIHKGSITFIPVELAELTIGQCEEYLSLLENGYSHVEAIKFIKLTKEQRSKYEDLLEDGEERYYAIQLAQLTDEQFKKYEKLLQKGEEIFDAIKLSQLTDEQYERYRKIPIKLSHQEAFVLAQKTNLTSITPEIIESFSDDFWHQTTMGCSKENYDIISKAIELALLLQQTKDEISKLKLVDDDSIKKALGEDDLKSLRENYKVNISQIDVLDKPCLLIENADKTKQYVAYNGIVTEVKKLEEIESKQFESWCNLSVEKQAPVLAKAAEAFVFNLFDEKGNCIIGQNNIDFDTKEKSDSETEAFYGKKLVELNKNSNLTAQDILKLIPKDSMLTISPYINDGNLLTAIVAEWFSKDGNRWQLEIHSQDLRFNDGDKWVFRLHKQITDINNPDKITRHYFQFNETKKGFDFNGDYLDEFSHVKIENPIKNGNLLKEGSFQKIIKSLSQFFSDNNEIITILAILGLTNVNNLTQNIKKIVDKLIKSPKELIRFREQYKQYARRIGRMPL